MSLLLAAGAAYDRSAALSQTLEAATLSAQGVVALKGTLSGTFDALLSSGQAALAVNGTLSSTLGAATLSSQGVLALKADLAATLGVLSLLATGELAPIVVPEPEPETPPAEQPHRFGGVGGFTRRELTDRERKELLRHIRRSLGLDAPAVIVVPEPEPPSMAGPMADLATAAFAAAAAREAEDEDVILLLAAGWRV